MCLDDISFCILKFPSIYLSFIPFTLYFYKYNNFTACIVLLVVWSGGREKSLCCQDNHQQETWCFSWGQTCHPTIITFSSHALCRYSICFIYGSRCNVTSLFFFFFSLLFFSSIIAHNSQPAVLVPKRVLLLPEVIWRDFRIE